MVYMFAYCICGQLANSDCNSFYGYFMNQKYMLKRLILKNVCLKLYLKRQLNNLLVLLLSKYRGNFFREICISKEVA